MKTMKKNALLLLAALACAAPASAIKEPKPDWIDGSSMEYPREKFLIGVGMADDRASAEDRARGEISKIFSTLVKVNTNLSESEASVKTGGKTENNFSQEISQNVQTASQKALEGVEVADNWQDPAAKQHYALAVLEREKASLAVKDRLADFDQQSRQWKDQLDKSPKKLPKVKAAMKLLALLKAREELSADLRVLDAGGKTLPGPFNEAEIKPLAAKAVAALDVVVALSGDSADEIETGLVQGLTRFGLQAKTETAGAADILVKGKIATKPMPGKEGESWKWARTTLTVSLQDLNGRIFARFDLSDRQASADYDEAARRSRVALAKKASPQINEAITAYFENQ